WDGRKLSRSNSDESIAMFARVGMEMGGMGLGVGSGVGSGPRLGGSTTGSLRAQVSGPRATSGGDGEVVTNKPREEKSPGSSVGNGGVQARAHVCDEGAGAELGVTRVEGADSSLVIGDRERAVSSPNPLCEPCPVVGRKGR
ncbi:unnamed protein product, partial [Discosporangium mesarthrocarpum]